MLTWGKQINNVFNKCEKVINVMRSLSGSTWGADRDSLLMIYRAMIRSRIDYGCIRYGTAAESHLKKLDVI